jgi:hypothetical protein
MLAYELCESFLAVQALRWIDVHIEYDDAGHCPGGHSDQVLGMGAPPCPDLVLVAGGVMEAAWRGGAFVG